MSQFSIISDSLDEPRIAWPEFIGLVTMTPAEAREEALALLRLADEAERVQGALVEARAKRYPDEEPHYSCTSTHCSEHKPDECWAQDLGSAE